MSANIRDGEVESSQEEMICSKCSEKIIGKAMKAGARHWHEACFVCADCGIKLIGAKVFQKNELLFCEVDYKKRFVPRCAACSGFILNECVRALNQTWHPEHFRCSSCSAVFDVSSSSTGIHSLGGRPHCKQCYIEATCEKCHGCSKPISDKALRALDHSWHVVCFVCKECGVSFEGKKSFYSVDGDPVCGQCLGNAGSY